MKKFDLIGLRYERLVVISEAEKKGKARRVLCICDCGKEKTIYVSNLVHGYTKSCGCLHKEITAAINTRHKMSKSREYHIWQNMLARCANKNSSHYKSYGGRGIKVCERWINSFDNFYADMGDSNGLSIDRINNDGNYEPDNCEWRTVKEQNRNTRSNLKIDFDGKILPLSIHCEILGLNYKSVHMRIKRGWSIEKALSTPF